MRGFQMKKTKDGSPSIDKFAYIAALSGGNFPLIMYKYAKDTTSSLLLDVDGINDPSEITSEELENIPETSMFARFIVPTIGHIVMAVVESIYFGDDDHLTLFARLLHSVFLEPFGIGAKDATNQNQREDAKPTPLVMTSMLGPKELYPAVGSIWNKRLSTEVTAALDSLKETALPGQNVVPDTDFLWNLTKMTDFQIPIGAYITPDEINIPMANYTVKYDPIFDPSDNQTKTAEPFSFDESVSASLNDVQPASEGPFSIAKMLGMAANLLPLTPAIGTELDEEMVLDIPTADGNSRSMVFADGGFNDPNGLPALVHKKVRKIISTHYLSFDEKIFNLMGWTSIVPLFGMVPDSWIELLSDPIRRVSYQLYAPARHFFDLHSNGENQIVKWLDRMNSLYMAGEPLITTLKDLDVVENKFWGIEGGYKVDLTTIVMIGVPRKFSEKVNPDVAPPPPGKNFTNAFGFFNNEELKTVPNMEHLSLETIIDIPLLGIKNKTLPIPSMTLQAKETRMSEILSSWTVTHAWDGLVGHDGEMKFEGFAEIFDEL
mmetsp:Transcript_3006/g.4383  ORF Transcript_3006/g.4383 Transcript_3006/m.4383 type:complete len:547 (+) Transcript_3006:305-1945(+)